MRLAFGLSRVWGRRSELNQGRKMWKKTTLMATEGFAAMGAAFQQKTLYCDEKGATRYCKMRASGTGLAAQWLGYALLAVFAVFKTLHAIETPGGGDDRQWLTFWVIMFLFSMVERFTDLLCAPHRQPKLCRAWYSCLASCHPLGLSQSR